MSSEVLIDGNSLNLEDVENVASNNFPVKIADNVREKVEKSRRVIDKILESPEIVYGINTGFGYLKNTEITPEEIEDLQEKLLLSHSAGVGEYFDKEIVRAMVLLRANALAKGFSGIRFEIIQRLVDFLNLDITPVVYSKGSVGSSGDLAPLSHMALPLIGKGRVFYKEKIYDSLEVLRLNNLEPIKLHAKEGLALINGTQAMSAIGSLVIQKSKRLADIADLISSMTVDALRGTKTAFRKEIHELRPHKGQIKVAENLTKLLQVSEIMDSHIDCGQVQDAYSLRCIPQVHGAVRDALEHAEKVFVTEINSVTDNPIILPDTGEVISGGNFHGEPLAITMDFISIALSELANISERRIERLVNPSLSNGLPPFLAKRSGLNSGYMIAQYTAAALVSENKSLAHPASVDSIPTSGNQEDHVSMGTIAARKALMILKNLENVLAIEAACGAQGLDFLKPLKPGLGPGICYKLVREKLPPLNEDREISEDIRIVSELISSIDFYEKIKTFFKK